MATIEDINIGKAPDDGTGDKIRDAFDKTNKNFKALNDEAGKGEKGDPGPAGKDGKDGAPGKDLSTELAALTERVKALEDAKP